VYNMWKGWNLTYNLKIICSCMSIKTNVVQVRKELSYWSCHGDNNRRMVDMIHVVRIGITCLTWIVRTIVAIDPYLVTPLHFNMNCWMESM
jgi:hypothetical protein